MFKAQKSPIICPDLEAKIKYDSAIVINQLRIDFYDKCYICGDKIAKDLRVEHFVPHMNDEDKKYDWGNLFLSCDYCNNIKSNTFNTDGRHILNSTIVNPLKYIQHTINYPDNHIEFIKIEDTKESINSIELLEKIYIGKDNQSAAYIYKKETLILRLRASLLTIINLLEEIVNLRSDDGHFEYLKSKIGSELGIHSEFYEFKKTFIDCNHHYSNYLRNVLCISID